MVNANCFGAPVHFVIGTNSSCRAAQPAPLCPPVHLEYITTRIELVGITVPYTGNLAWPSSHVISIYTTQLAQCK